MIVPLYTKTCHQGTMPNRACYIPSSTRRDNQAEQGARSDRFQLLNGDWKFKYYASIHDLNDLFYELGFNTGDYDTIPVPGVWQNPGYNQHQYANIRYPLPADTPYVSDESPCGAYVHTFNYQKDEKAPKAFLGFEGVGSCFYVWLNGQYLGYDDGFRANSEFDVTDQIVDGENVLAVLVLNRNNCSFLEDQENFYPSAVFRNVYLLKRPEQHIRDYFVTNWIAGGEATIRIWFSFVEEVIPVAIKLLNADNKVVADGSIQAMDSETSFTHQAILNVKKPILWNPDAPYLYTLLLESPCEVITDHVGIREVCIDNNKLYLNGHAIKLRGVRKPDYDSVT